MQLRSRVGPWAPHLGVHARGHYANPVAQGEQYTKRNGADVQQGFLVRTKAGTRTLDRQGFPGVTFRGEYPIGKVTYAEKGFPVTVKLEAFSPFIPLNAKDSALPATAMSYTVMLIEHRSHKRLNINFSPWMEWEKHLNSIVYSIPTQIQIQSA